MNKLVKHFDDFLSETNFMSEIDFQKPFKLMVNSPTGSGKTTYVINYLKENNIPFVFLADTLLLMKQISKDNNIDYYCAENRESYYSKQLISVYNHIDKFYKDKVIIIDEAHSLVNDYFYKKTVIENILAFGDLGDKIIMLSGTPLTSKDEFYKNVEYIDCVKNNPKKYNIKLIETANNDDSYKSAIGLALKIKSEGKIPVISMLDTKDNLNNLYSLLKVNGFNEIGLINSVVKNGEMDLDSTHYDELVNKSTITADAVITTYVQGYSINNENCSLIILPMCNRHSYVAIAQMVARFRKIENLDIYFLSSFSNKDEWTDFNKLYNVIYEQTKVKAVDLIERIKKEAKTSRSAEKLLELAEESSYLINNRFVIDEQMIANRILLEISNLLYTNITTANTILKQYNITMEKINNTNKVEKIEIENKTKKIDYAIAVDEFFNYLEINKLVNTPMGFKVKQAYDELKVFNLLDSEIKAILLDVFGNTKEYNRILNSYSMRFSQKTEIRNIRKELFKSIQVNKFYSSEEIFNIVSNIVNENNGKCESKSRASEILNCLFETESDLKRVDGKVIRGFNIKLKK